MKITNIIPTLLTLGNFFCGFGAVVCIASPQPEFLKAVFLILAATVFDMLDGKVARALRVTSDFGAQLDSLCDMVTFGIAPALLTWALSRTEPGLYPIHAGIVGAFSAFYGGCAALRLARFNIRKKAGKETPNWFCGLPVPAAAICICAVVIMDTGFERIAGGAALHSAVLFIFPGIAALLGLLMVSRIRYPYPFLILFRGRPPFIIGFEFVLVTLLVITTREFSLGIFAAIFIVSGPFIAVTSFMKGAHSSTEPGNQTIP